MEAPSPSSLKDVSEIQYAINFVLFACMGSGANWILPTALFQQIPYLIDHSPEGLCIATYMNVAVAAGIIVCMGYVYLMNRGYAVPYEYSVPFLLALSCVGTFFSAGVYDIIVFDMSFMLFICCLIGGIVGALANVIMNPFMTRYENDYISAARSGGSGGQLLVALIALIQAPGANSRFSPSVFLIIFGVFFIPPLFAWKHITSNRIGERDGWDETTFRQSMRLSLSSEGKLDPVLAKTLDTTYKVPTDLKVTTPGGRPLSMIQLAPITSDSTQNPMATIDEEAISRFSAQGVAQGIDSVDGAPAAAYGVPSWCPAGVVPVIGLINYLRSCVHYFFHEKLIQGFIVDTLMPQKFVEENPYIVKALPYMITVGWVNFNTWGMLSAVTPFAIYNAANGADISSQYLAYTYEIAAFTLMLGDFSTTKFKMPFDLSVLMFSILTFVVYSAAFGGVQGDSTPLTPCIMVAVCCIGRFIEAHLITSSYRVIATEFDVLSREHASRAVGLTDQISTVSGAIVSTILVTQLVNTATDDYSNGYYYHHKGC